MMLKQWFNNVFYGWTKWIIYLIGVTLIICLDRFNVNFVTNILKWFLIISLIWLINIILRRYFLNQVIIVNKFIYKWFPIIIKLRKEIINVPYVIRIILSLFMFLDMFLIEILYLRTRGRNFFYFIRLLIYYNVIAWTTLPFYLINDLYVGILFFLENGINIRKYVESRINFFILTILCALLFNIKWIDIIIIIWILDKIITTYYYWIVNYLSLKNDINKTWNIKSIALKQAFNNTNTYYEHTATELIDIMNYRDKVILLFKGINSNDDIGQDFKNLKFRISLIIYNKYINFWNTYYIEFQMMKGVMWKYYESFNDEDFILKYIHIYVIGSEMDNESFEKKQLLIKNISDILEDDMSIKFYTEFYYIIYNVLIILKTHDELRHKFFKIREKYDLTSYADFTEEEEVKEFFIKLYEYADAINGTK